MTATVIPFPTRPRDALELICCKCGATAAYEHDGTGYGRTAATFRSSADGWSLDFDTGLSICPSCDSFDEPSAA